MKKIILWCALSAFAALLFVANAPSADTPTTGGGLTRVTHDSSLTGSGTVSNPLAIAGTVGDITGVTAGTGITGGGTSGTVTITLNETATTCGASQAFTANTSTGVYTCSTVGDITSVGATANMGLTGGATSGAATLGLLSTCADGQVLKSGSTGTTWTCSNDLGTLSGLTNNQVMKATSTTTIGNSSISDNGTTVTVGAAETVAGALSTQAATNIGNDAADVLTLTGLLTANSTTGTNGQALKMVAGVPQWSTDADSGGDITSVVAGTGISGGATSGAATVTLNMTAQSCSAGQHISAATATGVFTCTADAGGITGTLTSGKVPLANGTSSLTDSVISQSAGAVTIAGTTTIDTSAGALSLKNSSSGTAIVSVSGLQVNFHNGFDDSYMCFAGGGDDYIRPCSSTGKVIIGDDGSTGGVIIGSSTMPTEIVGILKPDGHVYYQGTAPTLSGCTSQCTMRADSTDSRGTITCTDSTGSACTVTFATAFTTNAPACAMMSTTSTRPAYSSAPSTTAFSFARGTGLGDTGAQTWTFLCDGTL
jgi:hypothetical protein